MLQSPRKNGPSYWSFERIWCKVKYKTFLNRRIVIGFQFESIEKNMVVLKFIVLNDDFKQINSDSSSA